MPRNRLFPGKHKIHFFLAHVLLLVFQPSSVVPPAVTHKVIRGTPDRLLARLVDEGSNSDATYVEDFLLTHRTFYAGASLAVAEKLLQWFGEDGAALCDRVRNKDSCSTCEASFRKREGLPAPQSRRRKKNTFR